MPEGKNVATWETYPVEVGGTLYVTTNTDQVIAMDATTGKVKWKYTPKVKFYLAVAGGGGGVATNRGVVVADGKVFMQTFDNQLTALQSSTGELLWKSEVADPEQGLLRDLAADVLERQALRGQRRVRRRAARLRRGL